ncbi:MAG: hypothetical protein BWY21_00015 [Parcubacteria group bacterium ADurb.Bin216]|nr:MAG: hypothetical protein BWY21_00015 [Parcubacteria group bacterium ADurb.Bin216]
MKYDATTTQKLLSLYSLGATTVDLAVEFDVPERSIIAKLASLGVYKRKEYVNKRGEVPVKKKEYIERIAKLLNTNVELLESLEKVNKNVLHMLEDALTPKIEKEV